MMLYSETISTGFDILPQGDDGDNIFLQVVYSITLQGELLQFAES